MEFTYVSNYQCENKRSHPRARRGLVFIGCIDVDSDIYNSITTNRGKEARGIMMKFRLSLPDSHFLRLSPPPSILSLFYHSNKLNK